MSAEVLSAHQLQRLVQIMRDRTPEPAGDMLIHEYHLATVRHDFIDALEVLSAENKPLPR